MTTARPPLAKIYLYHDEIFNLVKDEDPDNEQSTSEQVVFQGEVYDSLGEYQHNALTGEVETRKKIQQSLPGTWTDIDVSPDFDPSNNKEFAHLADTLLDRHAPGEHIVGLHSPDNEALGRRLAAVMGVEYLTTMPQEV